MKNAFLLILVSTALFSCKKTTSDVDSSGTSTPAPITWQKISNKAKDTPGVKLLTVTDDKTFYYGYYTKFYYTFNGGKKFIPYDFNHTINNIYTAPDGRVFVLHSEGVEYLSYTDTLNNILYFTRVSSDSGFVEPKSIIFRTPKFGYIVAKNGVFQTGDGGTAWNPAPLLKGSFCYLSFVEENIAYAIGENGVVKKSLDGGLSWFPKASYNGTTAVYATFVNKNTGFISTGSKLYVTRDGAETYTEIFYGQKVVDFKFISSTEGFLTTIDGTVHHTNDAGVTWEIDNDRLFIQYFAIGRNGKLYGSNDAVYKRN